MTFIYNFKTEILLWSYGIVLDGAKREGESGVTSIKHGSTKNSLMSRKLEILYFHRAAHKK